MRLQQYWSILVKQWRLIVICFLTVGAVASIASRLMTPLYQSTALLQVAVGSGNDQTNYTSLLASDRLVQTEAVLATSDPVLREVASHYRGLTVERLSQEVTAVPKLNTQIFEIDVLDPNPTRAAALANDIAKTLVKQRLQITEQGTARSDLLVVQLAQPHLVPVQPNIPFTTGTGLLAGLFLGILLAVLFEQLDTRVRTPETLGELLDLPVLATIWLAHPSDRKDTLNPKSPDANVESYRILRTHIGFSTVDKPIRSLVVTSAMQGEGKSVVAANLAIFMAKTGKNTLLIDADLRHPIQQDLFGLSIGELGLSNALLAFSMSSSATVPSSPAQPSSLPTTTSVRHMANLSLDSFVYPVGIPNLWVMPSGPLPPNSPELLESKAMQSLLTEIANCGAEAVIFDAPPLLGFSDASILASKVDSTLVVIDITRARKKNLEQMKALLMQAGARILGCVMNKQSPSRGDKLYSYFYYPAGGQNGKSNHSTGNMQSLAVHANGFKQPET